ncbi:MAG: hypothetical protein HQ588_01620 [Deltaproteobacteria bacterium]|nr:hypothetical protein [Deltaproteobacteria bacterium]
MDWELITNVILGLVIIGLAIVTIKLTRRKKPVWAYTTKHIIGRDAEAPPELKYIFGTREVTEVFKTTIIFFNRGNEKFCGDLVPIGNSDLNKAVIIELKGAEILRPPSIQKMSKGVANSFRVEKVKDNASAVELHFQILNHNDGAIFDVWHTRYDNIDIPNAEITRLKEFTIERPENFWGGIIAPPLIMVFLLWMLLDTISNSTGFTDYLGMLAFVVIIIAFLGLGMRSMFKHRVFPSWSRE